ncbi:SapC family protein, partial [Arthrospira platensis SPKY1]|nr:SapC family protein [Arthrospira platensis SPKY1]
MPRYEPVAASTHATQRWQRYSSHAFAATDAVAPLVVQELPKACMHLAIAFIPQGEHFTPVAVLGLQPGQNLFVTPDGRWLGGYTPAAYRGHPFALANTPNGQQVLCVDADSGLLHDRQ